MAVSAAVARRYAQAYFDLARELGEVSAWREQLVGVAAVLTAPEVAAVLQNPRVPVAERERLVGDLLKDASTPARNLAALLVERGRAGVAGDVLAGYDRLADRASGVVRAEVVAAVTVDDDLRSRVARTLSEQLGGEVQTTVRQDPEILGGLVIRIGDRVIDGSVRTRLQQLQATLA